MTIETHHDVIEALTGPTRDLRAVAPDARAGLGALHKPYQELAAASSAADRATGTPLAS